MKNHVLAIACLLLLNSVCATAQTPPKNTASACGFVTQTEAATLLPDAGPGQSGTDPGTGGTQCVFNNKTGTASLMVQYYGAKYYNGDLAKQESSPIPGIGDKNYLMNRGATFSILKGPMVVSVTLISFGNPLPQAMLRERAIALMKTVAGRMK
jgi:hypothetical protein